MEDLGAYLKELREEKNISFDQIYEDLHLREEQIQLMEENRFSELGHLGFARAMVYNYARYMEADLDVLLEGFSYDDQIIQQFNKSEKSYNSIILIYDFEYRGDIHKIDTQNYSVEKIGSARYDIDN